ncbi:Rap/Ran-GAP [Dacryopinax primogenitus]|uniref:Rap/Ran-GAP n=1 Tax=Dacryopinax primogenitus (strain DJM 731) TaxID=1858805 RepID=M5FVZ7_DACPD|nr:Rap/Ran-GAP [Dacryopinax primogenitus]EJU00534.1 Rap/Ran-GAP [Dacryopinax primogenitus]
MTTYEIGIIQRIQEGDPDDAEYIANTARHWLPVSVYLSVLINLLRTETDWELVSYVLVHFTAQLANKHLFCGPKLQKIIPDLVVAVTQSVTAGSPIDRIPKPKGVKNTDVHGLVYNLIAILIGHKGNLERTQQDALVDVLQEGLTRDSATAKPCLQALAIACFELPLSITRSLPKILPKLTQIMSASATSVHIIELICVIGSIPQLYSNFTREDYQRVFGVAVQYIQYHNSAQATETGLSYSLSQHILLLAYYSIYIWFLSIPLLERPKYVSYIARGLQLAVQNKGGMDEPTEVCFDWLTRYTWANADPKPHKSFLSDVIMRPTNEPDTRIEEKHYLQGHSIITIRTVTKRGWSEIVSHRPSGTTQLICKLENLPTTGPGEFAPDPVTAQALVMADRDLNVIGSDGGLRPLDAMTGYVWVGSAPSQRRKPVSIHPSFLPAVIGPFPGVPTPSNQFIPLSPSETLARTLRLLNSSAVIDVHKVGIIYVGPGQTTEAEIFSNQNGSPGYTSFLVNLGRLIRLKGQKDVYSGGLDLENDLDGEYAYAWWDDIAQVIYHAATLMPNHKHDTRFDLKKRHIGNDNIRIVWNDSGLPYKFDTLATEFQFVNIVIEPHSAGSLSAYSLGSHSDEYYKLTMQRAPGMPEFGPTGTLKIVSARNLPSVVRQISLLADFFTTIWTFTSGDRRRDEWVSSWRGRLQAIKRLQAYVRSSQQAAEGPGGAPAEMDFSLAY